MELFLTGIGIGVTFSAALAFVRSRRRTIKERARDRRPEPLGTTLDLLHQTEARYQTLIEQIPAVIYTESVGEPGGVMFISPQVRALLGYSPEEWLARPDLWVDVLHPDDRDRVVQECVKSNQSLGSFLSEYRMIARDGRVVWFRDEAVLVRDAEGKPLCWQGLMLDITERKEAEHAVQHALEREQEAGERLRALDELKDTFLRAVSHDLRTPLTVVLGTALTLRETRDHLSADDMDDLLERLEQNAKKLDRLLSDLLDLERLNRGLIEPERRPTDVAAVVRRMVNEAAFLDDRKVDVHVEPAVLMLDESKVERILENLLGNAARHTPAGTPISVAVAPERNGILIRVEDHGASVPEEFRKAIFDPFSQGPQLHEHAPGVGIGLSLVARFAQIHGGKAWVETCESGGASFRVYLPGERVTGNRVNAIAPASPHSSPR
ncbi:MAG: PAS domain-containing protein [Actinomycetota bacterium]|nr:PAS domain-containing protein [Actinomycetota bacterium]